LLTLYNHAAAFTTIADGAAVFRTDFFKISTPCFMDGKTFRTAVASKLFFSNGKMAVPAAQLIAPGWHQPQDFVLAGFHNLVVLFARLRKRFKKPELIKSDNLFS